MTGRDDAVVGYHFVLAYVKPATQRHQHLPTYS